MSQTVTIGLLADPGLPERVAGRLGAHLPESLSLHADEETCWRVETSREALPLTPTGEIPLLDHAPRLLEDHGWDAVVYLTDLPRRHRGDPMLAELDAKARAALVTLPALGAWRVTAHTRALLVPLIATLMSGSPSRSLRTGAGEVEYREEPGDTRYVTRPGPLNKLRLLAGMVRNNQPGRILPALSNTAAAAVGTGAFGIFYASIWSMADSLPPGRLTLISILMIAALSFWLIFHNGLWTRKHGLSGRESPWLDNAATIITVGLSVAMMYLALYAVLLTASLAIITNDYLSSQLHRPVSFLDYLQLTWLASSLGTMAGALGSNFDSDQAIRAATYSRRERERRRLAEDDGTGQGTQH